MVPSVHHGALGSSPTALTLILICSAAVCAWGWLRLRSTGSNVVPAWRAGSVLAGLFLIWVAVSSPIASLDHELLTAPMIQHLLLMTTAPPLLWMGAPLMRLSFAQLHPFVRAAAGARYHHTLRRVVSPLTQPAFCWLAATVTLVGWHVPAAFTLGMRSEGWHIVEQLSF